MHNSKTHKVRRPASRAQELERTEAQAKLKSPQ